MPLSPEESQTLTSLQQQILRNVAAGKPRTEGITQEQLSKALDLLRGDRAKAMQAGAAKPGAKKKAAPKTPEGTNDLDAKLKARGLDLSKLD